MSRRFFPLSEPKEGSRFANLSERLNAPLPGEPMYAEMSDNDYPGAGSRSSRPVASAQTAKAPAKAKAAATVSQPKAQLPTPAEAAHAAGIAAKERATTVMASAPAQSRKKQAETLLMLSCDEKSTLKTSSAIIAELAKRPTDAEVEAVGTKNEQAKADAVWDRARNVVETNKPTHGANATASDRNIDAMWARAWSKVSA